MNKIGFQVTNYGDFGKSRELTCKKIKLYCTCIYSGSLFILGMIIGGIGAQLPGLGRRTSTNVSQQSFLFLARALGYTIGGYYGGKLVDKYPGNRVLALSLGIISLSSFLTPFPTVLWLLCFIFFFMGIAAGILDAAVNTLLVWAWKPSELNAYMQTMHFFFGFGAFISPIITAAVLDLNDGDVSLSFYIQAILTLPFIFIPFIIPSPINPDHAQDNEEKEVVDNTEDEEKDDEEEIKIKEEEISSNVKYSNVSTKFTVITIATFLFMAVGAEVAAGAWISTYSIGKYNFSEIRASHLTSAFWLGVTFGRLVAIPLSLKLSNRNMIYLDICFGILSSLSLILIQGNEIMLWIAVVILGWSIASLYPSAVSLPGELNILINGKSTGWFVFGASLGEMIVPVCTGHLMDALHYIYMAWMILICFIGCGISINILLGYVHRHTTSKGFITLKDDDNEINEQNVNNSETIELITTF